MKDSDFCPENDLYFIGTWISVQKFSSKKKLSEFHLQNRKELFSIFKQNYIVFPYAVP